MPEDEGEDEAYDGWENDTWSSNSPSQSNKKVAEASGWEEESWSMDPQEKEEESGWGGEWEDNEWDKQGMSNISSHLIRLAIRPDF